MMSSSSNGLSASASVQCLGALVAAGIAVYILNFLHQVKARCPRVEPTARVVVVAVVWIQLVGAVIACLGSVYIIMKCGGDVRRCGAGKTALGAGAPGGVLSPPGGAPGYFSSEPTFTP
jgi:hypothetical protein